MEDGVKKKYTPATGPIAPQKCTQCGSGLSLGGPIWSEPMQHPAFVQRTLEFLSAHGSYLKTSARLQGVLTMVTEELLDVPLYYVIDKLANTVHCNMPSSVKLRSALISLGYRVSGTHANRTAFKTDAPSSVVWDILRCWVKRNPVNMDKLSPNSPARTILANEPSILVSFEALKESNPKSKEAGLVRFPINPTFWGPKSRNRCCLSTEDAAPLKRKRHESAENKKTIPCKRLKSGFCSYGDRCYYSHTVEMPQPAESHAESLDASLKNGAGTDEAPLR